MQSKITFISWLRQQVKRNDRVGDLARDAKLDSKKPHAKTVGAWTRYLEERNAAPGAITAAKQAWQEYGQYTEEL